MPYKELKSMYYSDSEECMKEYLRRFNSDEAVKINFNIGENQAFFMQNAEVMTMAYNIARTDKRIAKLCAELPGVAKEQYTKKCLIDEIVITNKIEGVRSSRKEIGETLDILELQSKAKGKKHRFIGLVNKYLKLINGETVSLKNCKDIRDIYDEVFLEEIIYEDSSNKPDGKIFRKEAVSVCSETDKVIHTGLVPEDAIIDAMNKALIFLNDNNVDEIFRVCIFHYLIEYIHPFYDGNGRLGRFILSYGISKTLTSLIAFRISETIKENINLYYKAFRTGNDRHNFGDLTPFLLMQLNMICSAMNELEESLNEKLAIWGKYEFAIKGFCEDNADLQRFYSLLIQAALFSEKGISMKQLNKHMNRSTYIINNFIKNDIPEGFLIIERKGKFKYYSLNTKKLDSVILEESKKALKS